jgi:ERCC4-type nuclease
VKIDTRAGSEELIPLMKNLGVQVSPEILAAGDVEILANGPGGPIMVGVEYKKLGDLIQSMRSGRFADQLRKMKEAFTISWLLIEGTISGFRPGSQVYISTKGKRPFPVPGNVTYHEIISWAMTMCMQGGVLVWRTNSQEETAAWLRSLYLWCTAKEWDAHTAMLDFYQPPPIGSSPFKGPTLCQKWARDLPGIGSDKAVKVAKHFKVARALANATVEEWREVKWVTPKGRKMSIGPKGADKIVEAINESD